MKAVLLILIASSFGCGVVQYSPALDTELTEAGRVYLSQRTVEVVDHEGPGGDEFRELSNVVSSSQESITVHRLQLQYSGAVLIPYALTLGIIPGVGSSGSTQEVVFLRDGVSEVIQLEVHSESIGGWVACLMWVLPGWEFSFNQAETQDLSVRSFYTLINRLAADELME
jgi:hypothetical protein